jgi:TM2 domain-containing membrane protein YozV
MKGKTMAMNAAPSQDCFNPQPTPTLDDFIPRKTSEVTAPEGAKVKRIDKNVFVWVCSFLFGGLGIDRFSRGQAGIGILKILTEIICFALGDLVYYLLPGIDMLPMVFFLGMFVWSNVDFLIAVYEAYGSAFKGERCITFVNGKYAR